MLLEKDGKLKLTHLSSYSTTLPPTASGMPTTPSGTTCTCTLEIGASKSIRGSRRGQRATQVFTVSHGPDLFPTPPLWATEIYYVADEHQVELNTLARFFSHYSQGTLPSGARMRTTASSLQLTDSLQRQMSDPPPAVGGVNLLEPIRRLFNALGSRANTQHAVFTVGGLNLVKTAVSNTWHNQSGLRLILQLPK